MKISISDSLLSKYPSIIFAFSLIENVKVFGPDEESNKILTDSYDKVREKYSLDNLSSHPNSQAYINFAKNLRISPDSAFLPYLQIKRVLNGKNIGNINNVVNEYMAQELLYNLSLSAYDLDTIIGDVIADISNGGGKITVIGGEKCNIPTNDLILSDTRGVFYSFSQGYRDTSKITTQTKNVLFVIDAPEGISKENVEKCIKDLLSKFNSESYFILDKSNSLSNIR